MKKILILTFAMISVLLVGCNKNNEEFDVEYTKQSIQSTSYFSDDSFEVDITCCGEKDARDTANFFYVESFPALIEEVKDNEYYIYSDSKIIRFKHNNEYYIIEYIRDEARGKFCKLKTEYVSYIEFDGEGKRSFAASIPYPCDIYPPVINNLNVQHDASRWNMLKEYYENSSYETTIVGNIMIVNMTLNERSLEFIITLNDVITYDVTLL